MWFGSYVLVSYQLNAAEENINESKLSSALLKLD